MIQAIVGLWRKVGIEAEIEIYEIAKHYELRGADQLAPAAFYNWGNSVGDPTTSTGFAMFGPSPHSVWDGEDLINMIGPLWGEKDEAKRIDGWKAVDRDIAENALVIPLLQYVQPILSAPGVVVTPHASGALLPHLMKRAKGPQPVAGGVCPPPQPLFRKSPHKTADDPSLQNGPPVLAPPFCQPGHPPRNAAFPRVSVAPFHHRHHPFRGSSRRVFRDPGRARQPDRHDAAARRVRMATVRRILRRRCTH